MPQLDLVVVLDAPALVIRERKAELSIDGIEAKRVRWAAIDAPRKLSLDSGRSSEELANRVVARLSSTRKFKKYPPFLGNVLIPIAPRWSALVGSTLYTPARDKGLVAQWIGRTMIRLLGSGWLRDAAPGQVPFDAEHRAALDKLLKSASLRMESVAFYTRTQAAGRETHF